MVFLLAFTAKGDSRTPFLANVLGLGTNMILDPLLIFGIGPICPHGGGRCGNRYGDCTGDRYRCFSGESGQGSGISGKCADLGGGALFLI